MKLRGSIVFCAVLVLVGCKGEKRDAPPSTPTTPTTPTTTTPPTTTTATTPTAPTTAAACETLDRAECLGATLCTMHWIESSKYECRASVGACEIDLVQTDKPTCESRPGCEWKPGNCYCPFPGYGATQVEDKEKNSGDACACGGGAPPRCAAAQ